MKLKSVYVFITAFIILLAGVFYYLYTTYPNQPVFELAQNGYQVHVNISFPEESTSVRVSDSESQLLSTSTAGSHVLEYERPGEHTYMFTYKSDNLLGMQKELLKEKRVMVEKLSASELTEHFDFPQINLSTREYGVYASYTNLREFESAEFRRNDTSLTSTTSSSIRDIFLEHAPPSDYSYKVVFSNQDLQKLDGLLYQTYEISVEPIAPKIISVDATPLTDGYQTDVTATVEDASSCETRMLLAPPEGYERAGDSELKTHQFSIGDGLDYFGEATESWSWTGVLFPDPRPNSNLSNHELALEISCADYYNTTDTTESAKVRTTDYISQRSISINFVEKQSGEIFAGLSNHSWEDFTCDIRVGDQGNFMLDEFAIELDGHRSEEFGIDKYNRNALAVTAFCENEDGEKVTKVGSYRAE